MRVNVYAEELEFETEFFIKIVDYRRFYGIRMYLKSAKELHHTKKDDDRSAITFWVPWRDGKNYHNELLQIFEMLHEAGIKAMRHDIDNG